mmetsp:Transcript_63373/g.131824  ORF Transcript_63373/g.131824 Transcript_63373/m.131824 type:complete len:210 (+) Transcript_63373:233-862(+)
MYRIILPISSPNLMASSLYTGMTWCEGRASAVEAVSEPSPGGLLAPPFRTMASRKLARMAVAEPGAASSAPAAAATTRDGAVTEAGPAKGARAGVCIGELSADMGLVVPACRSALMSPSRGMMAAWATPSSVASCLSSSVLISSWATPGPCTKSPSWLSKIPRDMSACSPAHAASVRRWSVLMFPNSWMSRGKGMLAAGSCWDKRKVSA